MNREIEAVLQTPAVAKRLEEQGAMAETMTPAKFRDLMLAEQEKWMKVVREANIGDG
jgi:tripartite-type tricarboxylate transporter receptor subunit TctC